MPKASVKRLIECKKNDLIDLVLDIEKYPEFVPFCFAAKIYENQNDGDITKIIADSCAKGLESSKGYMPKTDSETPVIQTIKKEEPVEAEVDKSEEVTEEPAADELKQ